MRRLIWSGAVLFGLVSGCASKPETAPEPEVAQSESLPAGVQPGEAPTETTSEGGKAPIHQIVVMPSPQPKDAINIESVRASGGVLEMSVSHGGGCAEHTYTLAWDGELHQGADGTPVAKLVLVHDANGDRCKAIKFATPRFDLAPIAQRFGEKFARTSGAVDLALPGQATARYEF